MRTNYCAGICDAVTGVLIVDDSQVTQIRGMKVYAAAGTPPRAVITGAVSVVRWEVARRGSVWERFGNVPNYVEPFAGSLAVLLARPTPPRVETVNDKDCYLANFWRALQHDPEASRIGPTGR
jgi:hypothetical protein